MRSIETESGLSIYQRVFVESNVKKTSVLQVVNQIVHLVCFTLFSVSLILHGTGTISFQPWQVNILWFLATIVVLGSMVLTAIYTGVMVFLLGFAKIRDAAAAEGDSDNRRGRSIAETVAKMSQGFVYSPWRRFLRVSVEIRRFLMFVGFVVEGWTFSAIIYGMSWAMWYIVHRIARKHVLKELRSLTPEDIHDYETRDVTPATEPVIDVTPTDTSDALSLSANPD